MKKNIIITATVLFTAASVFFSSCKKDDDTPPVPVEQELITTVRLTLTDGAHSYMFTYRVENGFNSGTPGIVQIDTVRLTANTVYAASLQVLNEQAAPGEQDVTEEIEEEKNEHLFLYVSEPVSGAGSLSFSNGSTDDNNEPFNLTGTLTSGAAGTGTLTLYLMHEPSDKNGTTPDASGGDTDIEAKFPVVLQ